MKVEGEGNLKSAPEEWREKPLVEVAFDILANANEPFYYRDLMEKVAELRGMAAEEVDSVIARLYTDINIDGRFLCIGENVWGLRRWYPTERTAERGSSKRFFRKDLAAFEDEGLDLEDEELLEEEPLYVAEPEESDFEEDLMLDEDADFVAEEGLEEESELDEGPDDEEDADSD